MSFFYITKGVKIIIDPEMINPEIAHAMQTVIVQGIVEGKSKFVFQIELDYVEKEMTMTVI